MKSKRSIPLDTWTMPRLRRALALAATATGALVFYRSTMTAFAQQPAARSGLAFERTLPEMDGRKLLTKVADVRVAPGASSAPHTHGCAVVVYVISGAMRMQVRGGRDSVYHAGGVFFELPTDIHQVSANASTTDSAHFTATFVCDHVGPLSSPAP